MSGKGPFIPIALAIGLAACAAPPNYPARLSLHNHACQEPELTPRLPVDEFEPAQKPILAGGTIISGDFLISLWLYCDPSLSSDDPNTPEFSEVRYLGLRSEWQYLGHPIDRKSTTVITISGEQVNTSGAGPGVTTGETNIHMGAIYSEALGDAIRDSRPVEFLMTISAPDPLAAAVLRVTFASGPEGIQLATAELEERGPR